MSITLLEDRTYVCISVSTDLEVFKLDSSFSTPLESITISSIFGIVLFDIRGSSNKF